MADNSRHNPPIHEQGNRWRYRRQHDPEQDGQAMTSTSRRPIPLYSKSLEPQIVCSDNRPRIEPGEYRAFCRAAKLYFDKALARWIVMDSFDVLADNLLDVIAKRVPLFFNLGNGEYPKAGRRSLFYYAWCLANGAPPARSDRMPLSVFVNRMARVLVRDTRRCLQNDKRAVAPYSVIARVLEWETGRSGVHLINRSADQGRHGSTSFRTETCKESMSIKSPFNLPNEGTHSSALAGAVSHNTTQGDDRDDTSAVQRHAAPGQSKATSHSVAHGAVLKNETER